MRDPIFLLWLISREPGKRKTHYQYQTGWEDLRFTSAAKWLEERGLIVKELDGAKHKYRITMDGYRFLQKNGDRYFLLARIIEKKEPISTGDLYREYRTECMRRGIVPTTMRHVKMILEELRERGVISAKLVCRGRYGNTMVYELTNAYRRA